MQKISNKLLRLTIIILIRESLKLLQYKGFALQINLLIYTKIILQLFPYRRLTVDIKPLTNNIQTQGSI